MTQENEAKWRDEFVEYLHESTLIPNNKHDDPVFIDFHYHREWLCYLAGRKKGEEELDKYSDMIHHQRQREAVLNLKIETLKKELENFKSDTAVVLRLRDDEIRALKIELEYKDIFIKEMENVKAIHALGEQAEKNESLKKELDEFKSRCNGFWSLKNKERFEKIKSENQQLRELVSEAVIIVKAKDFTNAEEFLKEAELILK